MDGQARAFGEIEIDGEGGEIRMRFDPARRYDPRVVRQLFELVCKALRDNLQDLGFDHAPDFMWVRWGGVVHGFSRGRQADAVKLLWRDWERGGRGLSAEMLAQMIGCSTYQFRLRDVFRRRRPDGGWELHPAWGTLIVPASKGRFTLNRRHTNTPLPVRRRQGRKAVERRA